MGEKKVEDFIYEAESYKIRGCIFSVYNALGGGIKEKIIEKALVKELERGGLKATSQSRIDVRYKEETIGIYIPDLIINGIIIVELKSKPFLTSADQKQFWGYLKGSSYKLGFIVNFGPQRLTIKRFAHTRSA